MPLYNYRELLSFFGFKGITEGPTVAPGPNKPKNTTHGTEKEEVVPRPNKPKNTTPGTKKKSDVGEKKSHKGDNEGPNYKPSGPDKPK